MYGYFNRNAEQVVRVPVGPDNKIEPGAVDQGQPTVFFPGRQYGVFTLAQPQGQPKGEMVWSLTVAGRTMAIPGNVANQEFFIDPYREMGGSFPGNMPPELKLESAGPALKGPTGGTVTRTAAVGTPLPLEAWVTDDGLPTPLGPVKPGGPPRRALTVTWSEFRGPTAVTFATGEPADRRWPGCNHGDVQGAGRLHSASGGIGRIGVFHAVLLDERLHPGDGRGRAGSLTAYGPARRKMVERQSGCGYSIVSLLITATGGRGPRM